MWWFIGVFKFNQVGNCLKKKKSHGKIKVYYITSDYIEFTLLCYRFKYEYKNKWWLCQTSRNIIKKRILVTTGNSYIGITSVMIFLSNSNRSMSSDK